MKIYEMIFQKGSFEQTNIFYSENNEATRKHFIEYLYREIDGELEEFLLNSNSYYKSDLLNLLQEVHQESYFHLNTMKNDFIKDSEGKFDEFTYLIVKEHELISI